MTGRRRLARRHRRNSSVNRDDARRPSLSPQTGKDVNMSCWFQVAVWLALCSLVALPSTQAQCQTTDTNCNTCIGAVCSPIGCKSMFGFDSADQLCKPCDPNCLPIGGNECLSGAGKCDNQCNDGYVRNADGTCGTVVTSTSTSTSASTTTTPPTTTTTTETTTTTPITTTSTSTSTTTTTPTTTTTTPSVCSVHCVGGCATAGAYKCDVGACATGYTTDASNICVACSAACTYGCEAEGQGYCDPCTGTGTGCRSCAPGYKLYQIGSSPARHMCLQCWPHCITGCDSAGIGYCEECSGTVCKSCADGYVFKQVAAGPPAKYRCAACARNCDPTTGCATEGAGWCDTKCIDGYGLKAYRVGGVDKHVCLKCALYCTSGCASEGAGCCDSTCGVGPYGRATTWELKTGSTTCHMCNKMLD